MKSSHCRRFCIWTVALGFLLVFPANCDSVSPLPELALQKVLNDASPAFGNYVEVQSNTSNWYASFLSLEMSG